MSFQCAHVLCKVSKALGSVSIRVETDTRFDPFYRQFRGKSPAHGKCLVQVHVLGSNSLADDQKKQRHKYARELWNRYKVTKPYEHVWVTEKG